MEKSARFDLLNLNPFRVFLDSGLSQDVISERLKYDHSKLHSEKMVQRRIVIARYCIIEEECENNWISTFLFQLVGFAAYHAHILIGQGPRILDQELVRVFRGVYRDVRQI